MVKEVTNENGISVSVSISSGHVDSNSRMLELANTFDNFFIQQFEQIYEHVGS